VRSNERWPEDERLLTEFDPNPKFDTQKPDVKAHEDKSQRAIELSSLNERLPDAISVDHESVASELPRK
jgi:hypothetical protein